MGITLKIKLFRENQPTPSSSQPSDDRPLSAGYRCGDPTPKGASHQQSQPQSSAVGELGPVLQRLRALAKQTPDENRATTYKSLLEELDTLVKERQQSDPPFINAPTYIKFDDFAPNAFTSNISKYNKEMKINVKHIPDEQKEMPEVKCPPHREKVINLATHTAARRGMQEIRQTRVVQRGQEATFHAHTAASIQELMTKHLQQMQIQSQNYASCAFQNTVNIASQLAELAEQFTKWQSGHSPMPKDITLSLLR